MHATSVRRTRRAIPALLALAVGLAASGCGGDDADKPADENQPAASAALLGSPAPATGTPVKLGLLTDGRGTNIDFTSAQQTAQAAVKYVNEYLGGVAGHPIELFVCETKQIPANASDCANRMIEEKVPVVLNDISGVGGVTVPLLSAAGVPYFSYSGSSAAELTSPGAYSVTGSVASLLGGVAQYAKDQGIEKVSVVGMDIPAVTQGVQSMGKPAFDRAGVELNLVTVPPGTPDLTPQVQTVVTARSGLMLIFGDKTICSAGLKAARTLAYPGKVFIVQQCIDPTAVTSVPGGYQDVMITSVTNHNDGDAEFELYKAVLQQYAPDTAKANTASGTAMQGYSAVVGFARAMAGLPAGSELTPEVVKQTLESGKSAKTPLGGGAEFACNGTAVPSLPGMCSVSTAITTLTKDGEPTAYQPIDPAPLFH